MKIEELVEKYLEGVRQAFLQIDKIESSMKPEGAEVLDQARRYFADTVHYLENEQFETALASISYCEGLIDSLRLLKMVEFEWPAKR